MSSKPPRELCVEESLTLPCCGCAGDAIFTPQGERPTFFHTMPYCARFNAVNTVQELSAYMKECGDKALAEKALKTN